MHIAAVVQQALLVTVVAEDNNFVERAYQDVCFMFRNVQTRRNQFRKGISQDGKSVSRVVQKCRAVEQT
jgi:hypothetical protein